MSRFAVLLFFCAAAALFYFGVRGAVDWFENRTEAQIASVLSAQEVDWMVVEADGLRVRLSGFAPDEGSHLHALEAIGGIIGEARLRDTIQITRAEPDPPRFSLEILRNDAQISLIGLVPLSAGRQEILDLVDDLGGGQKIADMLETADYPPAPQWASAVRFGSEILRRLPRSKISVTADKVTVLAVTDSNAERQQVEAFLNQQKPDGIALVADISAPREVISPFVFRAALSSEGARLDICSADSNDTRTQIFTALERFNLFAPPRCPIGLGVPTPDWGAAVINALNALYDMGAGVVTLRDTDISLVADGTVEEARFNRVVGALQSALPPIFILSVTLPPPPVSGTEDGTNAPEFTATLSPEGHAQLRGRIDSAIAQGAMEELARSLFGGDNVYQFARIDADLPPSWSKRVMASLIALSKLHNGIVTMQPAQVQVRGLGKTPTAASEVRDVLSAFIFDSREFIIAVDYDEALVAGVPRAVNPLECAKRIDAVLAMDKIVFAPSSAELDAVALASVARIAEVLRTCPDVRFEIEGHTDSQGRDELNRSISQKRAEAVLFALLNERILTINLRAKGYGPDRPIADNGTEAGRSANRRIAFRLLLGESEGANDSGGEEINEEKSEEEEN